MWVKDKKMNRKFQEKQRNNPQQAALWQLFSCILHEMLKRNGRIPTMERVVFHGHFSQRQDIREFAI